MKATIAARFVSIPFAASITARSAPSRHPTMDAPLAQEVRPWADDSHNNEIDCHDVIQEPREEENEYSCNECHDRA